MSSLLYFEDLQVGDRWTSPPRRITTEQVHQFSTLTGDFHPLHWDQTYASETPFGRPIAHGMLGLSCAAGLSSELPLVETIALLGVDRWRFLKPIYHGDEIYLITEVIELETRGRRRGRVVWKQTVMNQDDQVTQEGLFETLIARRGAPVAPRPAERLPWSRTTVVHASPDVPHSATPVISESTRSDMGPATSDE